jgi:hypothetical protein
MNSLQNKETCPQSRQLRALSRSCFNALSLTRSGARQGISPDTVTDRPLRGEIRASPENASCLAREPEGHDRPMFALGLQVAMNQICQLVRPRPAHVGDQAGRRSTSTLDELIRHVRGIDWLEFPSSRYRYYRQLGHLLHQHQDRLMKLSGA